METIPIDLIFKDGSAHLSTFKAWKYLLNRAKKSIDLVAFYWNLQSDQNITKFSQEVLQIKFY